MKKTLVTLLMLVSSMTIWAQEFEVAGLSYQVIAGTSNVKITGNDGSLSGEVTVDETVVYSGVTYNVTEIGAKAFAYLPELTKLVIKAEIEFFEENYLYDNQQDLEILMFSLNPPLFADPYNGFYKGGWTLKIYEEAYSKYESQGWTGELQLAYITKEDEGITETLTLDGSVYYGIVNESELCVYSVGDASAITGSIVIPEKITYNDVDYTVTSLWGNCFKDCSAMTEIYLYSSISYIGASAFNGCSSLAKITLESTTPPTLAANAFDAYNAIVYVPEGSKEAYKSASTWSNFTYIYEPGEGVEGTTDDGFAFITTSSDEVMIIANSTTPYTGDVVIPEKITFNEAEYTVSAISGTAFAGNTNITSVTVPDGVIKIDESSFKCCTALKTVTLPSTVTSIGASTFEGCTALETITIPSGVTSIDNAMFKGCTLLKTVTLPSDVTSIGASAFEGCTALETITIPSGVTSIGNAMFKGCTSLKTVTLPSTVTFIGDSSFEGCSALTTINMSENLIYIGRNTFKNCSALTSLTIPSGVNYIDKNTIAIGCTSLKELIISDSSNTLNFGTFSENKEDYFQEGDYVILPTGLYFWENDMRELFTDCPLETIYIGRNIKNEIGLDSNENGTTSMFASSETISKVTFSNSVTVISDYIFSGSSKITSLTIPNSVTNIGSYAFSRSGITSLTIPSNVTSIGSYAFSGCSGITTLTIPSSVTGFGDNAFSDCTNLSSLTLSDGLTIIGGGAFANCTSLKSVNIPASVKTIGGNAFIHCSSLTDLTLANGVETIGGGAFYECNFESLVIPSSVKGTLYYGTFCSNSNCKKLVIEDSDNSLNLENFAIMLGGSESGLDIYLGRNLTYGADVTQPIDCASLETLTISDKVTEIGANLFDGCTNLSTLEISNSVTKIGENAFSGCTGLKGVLDISDNLTTIGAGAFAGTNYRLCRINQATPPTAGTGMFNDDGSFVGVIVPADSQTAYKEASGWSEWNILVEKELEVTVTTPGNISYDVISLGVTPKNVTKIKVNGTINESDFEQLRVNFTACYSMNFTDADCATIPTGAMKEKYVLSELWLPDNCTEIADQAFYDCAALKSTLTLPSGLEKIGASAFYNNSISGVLTVPASVQTISANAFKKNRNLTGVVVAEESSLSSLGVESFRECKNLESVDMSNAILTTIYHSTFTDCKKLSDVKLPSGLISLGDKEMYILENGAFQNCVSLTSIEFPSTLKTIQDKAFTGCTSLGSLTFPASIESIGANSFDGCSAVEDIDMTNCTAITSIGTSAFANCSALTKVDLSGCSALTTVNEQAFYNCGSMVTLNMPESVTTINSKAFGDCKSLANITVAATTPPTSSDDAFYHVNNYTCLMATPTASFVEYLMATPWGGFMEIENRKGIDVTVENDVTVEGDGNEGGKQHHCGHIWYDRDWHKHHGNGGAKSLNKLNIARELADEETTTTTTDVSGINGHMSDGLSVYVQNGGMVSFLIVPEDGYKIKSVLFGDEDVTGELVDGVFTTPAVTAKNTLKVTFSEDTETGVEAIGAKVADKCVYARDGEIVVSESVGEANVKVFTLNGALVYDGMDKTIAVAGNGMYIVVVKGKAYKVML